MHMLAAWGATIWYSLSSLAQNSVIVEEDDPSLVYIPPSSSWNHNFNPRPGPPDGRANNDYYHGGGYFAYDLEGASVTLIFNGSYIAYYSDMFSNHGAMEIELDNVKTTISTYSSLQYGTPQVKLFEAHVDPNTPDHKVTLRNAENKTMGLDYFLYTAAFPVIPVSPSSTSALHDISTSHSSEPLSTSTSTIPEISPMKPAAPPLAGPTIVGITIAATVVAVALAVGGAVCLRRRRRRIGNASSFSEVPWRPVSASASGETTTPYMLAPIPETPNEKRPKSNAFTTEATASSSALHICSVNPRPVNLEAPPSYREVR